MKEFNESKKQSERQLREERVKLKAEGEDVEKQRKSNLADSEKLQKWRDELIENEKEMTEIVKEKIEVGIDKYKIKHRAMCVVMWVLFAAQLIGNLFTDERLFSQLKLAVKKVQSVVSWATPNFVCALIITIALLAFFGYQYLKRFRDEFTIFAILIDCLIIEYAAEPIISSGQSLFVTFLIIQIVYIAIRDYCSENSGIAFVVNGFRRS
jgi:hypothetical protein